MSFQTLWQSIRNQLSPGTAVRNWTAAKGYLGDDFKVVAVSDTEVVVDPPNAESLQHIQRGDFEVTYDAWPQYCSGELQRQQLRDLTRFSKYTISILRHLEGYGGGDVSGGARDA